MPDAPVRPDAAGMVKQGFGLASDPELIAPANGREARVRRHRGAWAHHRPALPDFRGRLAALLRQNRKVLAQVAPVEEYLQSLLDCSLHQKQYCQRVQAVSSEPMDAPFRLKTLLLKARLPDWLQMAHPGQFGPDSMQPEMAGCPRAGQPEAFRRRMRHWSEVEWRLVRTGFELRLVDHLPFVWRAMPSMLFPAWRLSRIRKEETHPPASAERARAHQHCHWAFQGARSVRADFPRLSPEPRCREKV